MTLLSKMATSIGVILLIAFVLTVPQSQAADGEKVFWGKFKPVGVAPTQYVDQPFQGGHSPFNNLAVET